MHQTQILCLQALHWRTQANTSFCMIILETGYTTYWRKNLFHNPDSCGWRTHRRGTHPLLSRGPSQWLQRDIGLPTQRLASSILLSMVELSHWQTVRNKLCSNRTPFPWPGLSFWTFHGWTDTGFFSYFHSSYLLLRATGSWLPTSLLGHHWGAMHLEQADLYPWLIWRATGYSWTWNTNQLTNPSLLWTFIRNLPAS